MENLALHFAPIAFHIVMLFGMTEYYLSPLRMKLSDSHDTLVNNCLKVAFYVSWSVVVCVPIFHEVEGQALWKANLPLFAAAMIVYFSILAIAWLQDSKKKQRETAEKKPAKKSS